MPRPRGDSVVNADHARHVGGAGLGRLALVLPSRRARAGHYLTLRVTGAGQPAPVRSYSLSTEPDGGVYRISVKAEPHGAASGWLNRHARAGMVLEVAAPRGEFTLEEDTGPVLLISAGIGVTPVLAMLHQLAAARH